MLAQGVGTRQPKVAAAAAGRGIFPGEEAGGEGLGLGDEALGYRTTGPAPALASASPCRPVGPPSPHEPSSRSSPPHPRRPYPAPSPAGGWGGRGPRRTCVLVVSWITAFRKFSLESADPIALEPALAGPRPRLPPRPRLGIQLQLRGPRCSRRRGAAHPACRPGVGPAPAGLRPHVAPPPHLPRPAPPTPGAGSRPLGSATAACQASFSARPRASAPSLLRRSAVPVTSLPFPLSPQGPQRSQPPVPRPHPHHWSPRHSGAHTFSASPLPQSFFHVNPCPPHSFFFSPEHLLSWFPFTDLSNPHHQTAPLFFSSHKLQAPGRQLPVVR